MRRLFGGVGAAAYLVLGAAGAAPAQSYEDGLAAAGRHDDVAAMRAFLGVAERGDARAEYNLGRMYAQGLGAPRDDVQAVAWFTKAADQGNAGAEFNLGLMRQTGQGGRRDDVKAADWYLKAAAQGYNSAQVKLAAMYASGQGVARDEGAALAWYEKAAAQFDAEAELDLGLMYLDAAMRPPPRPAGPGMPQTQFAALMNAVFGAGGWRETGGYRSPARENQLRAEGALTVPAGMLSRHSLGDPAAPGAFDVVVDGLSPQEAAMRLRRSGAGFRRLFPESAHGTQGPHLHVEPGAIRAGAPAAAVAGPPPPWAQTLAQNRATALSWFMRAAAQGNAAAEFNLGLMRQAGESDPQDAATGLHWLLAAAQQGDGDAQLELGVIYMKGSGVPIDLAEARKWLRLAAASPLPQNAEQRRKAALLLEAVDREAPA